jgi:hypothetical protein
VCELREREREREREIWSYVVSNMKGGCLAIKKGYVIITNWKVV